MIEEVYRKCGRFDLQLVDAPRTVRDAIQPYGHVLVTPVWHPATATDRSTLMSQARWSGLIAPAYQHAPGATVEGWGLAALMGTPTGISTSTPGTDGEWTTFWLNSENLDDVIGGGAGDRAFPPGVTAGTIATGLGPTNSVTVSSKIGNTWRDYLDQCCDLVGATWRMNPDGSLDAHTAATLFNTTPQVILTADAGGIEPDIVGLQADLNIHRDVSQTRQRMVLVGESGAAATGSHGVGVNFAFGTDTITTTDVEKVDSDDSTELLDMLEAYWTDIEIVVDASIEMSDPHRYFECGDNVYVWDLVEGVVDTDNEVTYRGRTIHPVSKRVMSMRWPIVRGYGVYHISSDGNETITDLTPYVAWESGPVSVGISDPLIKRETRQRYRKVKPAIT